MVECRTLDRRDMGLNLTRGAVFTVDTQSSLLMLLRPKKKIVVFQVPCKKKTGSVGRLFFFFFFFFFFLLTVQTSSFPSSSPLIKYRQCHQAVDPGDMYYGRSFINSGKSRGPRTLLWDTPCLDCIGCR